MNVLYLGKPSLVLDYLISKEEFVLDIDWLLDDDDTEDLKKFDWLVCYGYRYLINKSILDLFPNKAINLHISYLPWNKGADPNFWSWMDNTPKGITIHKLDEALDTGDILWQKEIIFCENETLKTSYEKLTKEIEKGFVMLWDDIKKNRIQSKKQIGFGSYHKSKDKEKYLYLLERGYDTEVSKLRILN